MDDDDGVASLLVIVTSSSSSLRAKSSLMSVIGDNGLCSFFLGGVVDVDDVVDDEVVLESEPELEILVDELLLLGLGLFESSSEMLSVGVGVVVVVGIFSGVVVFLGVVLDVGFVVSLGFILIKVSGCCMRGRLRTVGSSSGVSSEVSSGVSIFEDEGVGDSRSMLFEGVILA